MLPTCVIGISHSLFFLSCFIQINMPWANSFTDLSRVLMDQVYMFSKVSKVPALSSSGIYTLMMSLLVCFSASALERQ